MSTKGPSRSCVNSVVDAATTRNAPCLGTSGTIERASVITSETSKPPYTDVPGGMSCALSTESQGSPRQYVTLPGVAVIGSQNRSRFEGCFGNLTRPMPKPMNTAKSSEIAIEIQCRTVSREDACSANPKVPTPLQTMTQVSGGKPVPRLSLSEEEPANGKTARRSPAAVQSPIPRLGL